MSSGYEGRKFSKLPNFTRRKKTDAELAASATQSSQTTPASSTFRPRPRYLQGVDTPHSPPRSPAAAQDSGGAVLLADPPSTSPLFLPSPTPALQPSEPLFLPSRSPTQEPNVVPRHRPSVHSYMPTSPPSRRSPPPSILPVPTSLPPPPSSAVPRGEETAKIPDLRVNGMSIGTYIAEHHLRFG